MKIYDEGTVNIIGTEMYMKGVADGIGCAIGTYILYRIGKFFVKGYIDYKIDDGVKKKGSAK